MSDRLTIWFLIRSLEIGGAQRQLVTLAAGLARRGHSVAVYALRPDPTFAEPLQAAGIRVELLAKNSAVASGAFLTRFVRDARRARVDVVHSYLPGQNVLAALLQPALKSRVAWGVRVAALGLQGYNWKGRASYRLERLLARTVPLIIVNSASGRDHLVASGYPAARLRVVRNGVDSALFRPLDGPAAALRQEWFGSDFAHGVIAGVVGRLDPVKGHDVLLDAAALLRAGGVAVRFVCVGGGSAENEERLRLRTAELDLEDTVVWAGPRADMAAVYNAFDLACSPSRYEALPNVLLEAMACGVPCVATAVGDAADVLGPTGILVPPGDAGGLAQGIRTMVERVNVEGSDLRRAARTRIEESFSVDVLVDRTEDLLRDLSTASR